MKRGLKGAREQIASRIHVKEDSPMKRGLKGHCCCRCVDGLIVKEDSPMKRGLKVMQWRIDGLPDCVKEDSPMKRGLKVDGALRGVQPGIG